MILWSKKKRVISYSFLCAKFKSARQNSLSHQVFEKNVIETSKNAFFTIFQNSYQTNSMYKTSDRAQMKV